MIHPHEAFFTKGKILDCLFQDISRDQHRQRAKMRNLLGPLAAVAALLSGALAQQRHDASFTPEYVLEALEGPIDIDCNSRVSVTLNGTSPGPPLTMREGHTTWVRVYNRLASQNVTVVSIILQSTALSCIARGAS